MTLPEPKHGVIYIYELRNVENACIYVGQTMAPHKRLGKHRCQLNQEIQLFVIDTVQSHVEADKRERDHIRLRADEGCNLLNKELYKNHKRPAKCLNGGQRNRYWGRFSTPHELKRNSIKEALLETKRNIAKLVQGATDH